MQKTRFCSSSFSVKDIQTGKKSLQNKQANFLNNLYSFKEAQLKRTQRYISLGRRLKPTYLVLRIDRLEKKLKNSVRFSR